MGRQLWSEAEEIDLQEIVRKEVDEQIQKYLEYPASTMDDIFDYTCADSSHLKNQKEECSKYFTNSKEH